LFDLPKYGDGVCLARMAELLDVIAVDRVWLQRVAVVVTGSNGKGSTAAFCAGIAHAYRLRTGLFTSPHLHHFNERFQVDGVPIGDDTLARLKSRIEAAIRRRETILGDGTNAARLIHAEGDDLSGLIVDRYADMLVVEIANSGLEQLKDLVIDRLERALKPRVVYFKNDLPARKLEQLSLDPRSIGEGEPIAQISENGLRFVVDAREGQKTGFFLDQRNNRALARTLAAGRSFINLFSYTGAFGVYAAAGGATSVENVDVSTSAIEFARRNHELNGTTATFTVADAFQFVRERSASSQLVDFLVCDPPAFARSRGDIDRAARGYKDVNLFALRMIEPGGMLMTFSCSGHMSLDLFQKVIFAAALDAGRRVSFVRRLTAGEDHPTSIYAPEGEYLKGFLLEVLE